MIVFGDTVFHGIFTKNSPYFFLGFASSFNVSCHLFFFLNVSMSKLKWACAKFTRFTFINCGTGSY